MTCVNCNRVMIILLDEQLRGSGSWRAMASWNSKQGCRLSTKGSITSALIGFLVDSPLLALVPCAALFLLAARTRDWLITIAATAWLVYAGYEWLMLHRVLCSGECNIRIDLLVLHPALIGLTIIALMVGFMRRRRG